MQNLDYQTKTVFDFDDVLLNLNAQVFPVLGLPEPKSFYYRTSGQYTQEQITAISSKYSDPKIFMCAEFFEGADKIVDLEKYTEVHICSRSFNSQVVDVKKIRVPAHTHIPLERMDFQIGVGETKRLPDDADIVVEDHIDNLRKLPSHTIRILIDKSYNRQDIREDAKDKVYRMSNLLSAIDFIKMLHTTSLIYKKEFRSGYYTDLQF